MPHGVIRNDDDDDDDDDDKNEEDNDFEKWSHGNHGMVSLT